MKTFLTLILALAVMHIAHTQEIKFKNFDSNALNAQRGLKIYIPESYYVDEEKFYPLTIVLDAEILFDAYVGNAKLFATTNKAPEQIIVGINQNAYNERYEDCSYNKENSLPTQEGEAFYKFVRGELLNYFEENYRVSPFKTVVGNTLTANFINYFFVEQYPGFNAYIAINPSYAMDMPAMLVQKIPTLKNEKVYYYLSNGPFNNTSKKEQLTATNNALKVIDKKEFQYQYDFFENSTQTAAISQSMAKALAFIFEIYSPISKEEFNKNIKHLSPADAIAYLENKYVEIEYQFGSNLKIRERDIIAIESIILDKENGDYLKDFGEMINKMYEQSPLGDYYIGMYYETGKKYKQALRYYKSGYMKLPEGDPNADAFYENVDRVLRKRDGTYIEQ